jgi:hypothetical protein
MPKILTHKLRFDKKILFVVVVGIILLSITDALLLKLYDLSSKQDMTTYFKKIIYSVMASICFILQLVLFKYTKVLSKTQLGRGFNIKMLNLAASIFYTVTVALISLVIVQMFIYNYYDTWILFSIILVTYGGASFFIGYASKLFISWYMRHRNIIILMYFISMLVIFLNLLITSLVVSLYLVDRPQKITEFIGGTIGLTSKKYAVVVSLHEISSLVSFLSIWTTTVAFSYSSRDKLVKKLRYMIMPALLLIYFVIGFYATDISRLILSPLLEEEPILFSSMLIVIVTLIKPIGGIMFGIAFWGVSKLVNFDKILEKYLIITACGFVFLFAGNQSTSLVLGPYPAFGTIVITTIITGSYLVTFGIYMSAILVSRNNELRSYVHGIAKQSKLLGPIGMAEMEKEVNKTVGRLVKEFSKSENEPVKMEFDKSELKDYVREVLKELRSKEKERTHD